MSETERVGMTESELQAIEARANAATPGPWSETDDTGTVIACYCSGGPGVFAGEADPAVYGGNDRADFAFIAAARSDVPTLIAEVRRLQSIGNAQLEELHRLRSEREMWQADKQAFDARAAECRQLRFERDDLRTRVNQLLGDLDRDAEEWLPYMREAATKDVQLDAVARGLMYEQMTSLIPPYGWSKDFGRTEWNAMAESQRERWRERAREHLADTRK